MELETKTSTLLQIPLSSLVESSTNARREFAAEAMASLIESIREQGIQVPLLVRPIGKVNDVYEIVAGARRFRAAKKLKLETVPALVRPMGDREAMTIQIIENLQRENLNPIEEALGYRQLSKLGENVQAIASGVGKSIAYVYQALKLLDLSEGVQASLRSGKLSAGHGVLIARLPKEHQEKALAYVTGAYGMPERSVRELRVWIGTVLQKALAAAPFKTADATLLPKAGACDVCPKNAKRSPDLYPELKGKAVCTDTICYNRKVQAHIAQWMKTHKEGVRIATGYGGDDALAPYKYRESKKTARGAQPAIIIDGPQIGRTRWILVNRPQHKAITPARERAQRAKEAAEAALRTKYDELLEHAILEKQFNPLQGKILDRIVTEFCMTMGPDPESALMARYKLKSFYAHEPVRRLISGLSATKKFRFMFDCFLAGDSGYQIEEVAAKDLRINVKRIKTEAKKQLALEIKAKQQPAQTSAKREARP